jgi:hypothetical protein
VRWPDAADELLVLLAEHARDLDTYVCPNVLSRPQRAKHVSVGPMEAHADIDGGRLDLTRVADIPGGCAVGSGSPGNGHVYALLDRPAPHHQHEQLCRALGAHLGAKDSKCSDNDMLRMPGTWNFKRTLDGNAPAPVTWLIRPSGQRVEPEELAAHLGVELADEPPAPAPKAKSRSKSHGGGAVGCGEVEPFDLLLYPSVRRALAKLTGDRSADTMHIVGACARAGLTKENARWAVRQRNDLAGRLDERHDDDIARAFGRACNSEDRT